MRASGKKLTRQQKVFLTEKGLEHSEWLCKKNSPEKEVFIHRDTKEEKTFNKQ